MAGPIPRLPGLDPAALDEAVEPRRGKRQREAVERIVADGLHLRGRVEKLAVLDGTADAYFVHPASGTAPGVLIWPDIFGLRPAFRQMGKRLAESGYAVLVVNQFYRSQKAPVVPDGAIRATPFTSKGSHDLAAYGFGNALARVQANVFAGTSPYPSP